jgi:hypothetical protein
MIEAKHGMNVRPGLQMEISSVRDFNFFADRHHAWLTNMARLIIAWVRKPREMSGTWWCRTNLTPRVPTFFQSYRRAVIDDCGTLQCSSSLLY